MISSESLNQAIAAHGIWKARLMQAIQTGKCEVRAQDAYRDDACAFGKWLHSCSGSPQGQGRDQGAHYAAVFDLHRRFHGAAGRVLDLALAGKKDEALKLLGTKSEYATISLQLTREIMEWKRELAS